MQALVGPLDLAQLEQRSYASDWSIAQVLSDLGSGAEIFGLFLQAGLAGQEPPGRDTFVPIWNAWNAKDPRAQAADGLRSDEATVERFESLNPDQKAGLQLHLFGMDTDITGLARMRGARFKGWNRFGWIRWTMTCQVKTAEPGRELDFSTIAKDRELVRWRYLLEPAGGGTDLIESFQVIWLPFTARLGEDVLMRDRDRRGEEAMRTTLNRIKDLAEGARTAAGCP